MGSRLSIGIYNTLNDTKDYGFSDRIQRATVSIPLNITVKLDTKKEERLEIFLNSSLYIDKDFDDISKSPFSRLP